MPIKARALTKIEPKTFFANERTFIQWLSAAVLLVSLGLALLAVGSPFGTMMGLVILPIAIGFMLYALWRYQKRTTQIQSKAAHGYEDRHGPTVLVIALVAACVFTIFLKVQDAITATSFVMKTGPQPSVPTQNSKGFQMLLKPSSFMNRTKGLETIMASRDAMPNVHILAAADVSSLQSSLCKRIDLDTSDGIFLKHGVKLRLRDWRKIHTLEPDYVDVTLKRSNYDADLLRATALFSCASQYDSHCHIKFEQNIYLNASIYGQSAKIDRLPIGTVVSSVRQMAELFGDPSSLNASLGLMAPSFEGTGPLYVSSRVFLLRTQIPFKLGMVNGNTIKFDASIDLYYETESATGLPIEGRNELSFKVKTQSDGSYDQQVLQAAHNLFGALASETWAVPI